MSKDALYNQHYVPRFLLRGFTRGKKKQFYVFDKQTDNVFKTNPEKVAAEKSFYDMKVGEQIISLDPSLDILDGKAAKVINTVLTSENLLLLSTEERACLALFVAIQYLRVKQRRDVIQDFSSQIYESLKFFADMANARLDFEPFSHDVSKKMSLEILFESAEPLARILVEYTWVLLKAQPLHPFHISDHPVVLNNRKDFGIYGSIGFGLPGIEIAMPLNESLTLLILSDSHTEGIENLKVSIARNLLIAQGLGKSEILGNEAKIYRALEGAGSLPIDIEQTKSLNALQVLYSGRWIFSPTDDFSLVKKIIEKDPNARRGRMMKVFGLNS